MKRKSQAIFVIVLVIIASCIIFALEPKTTADYGNTIKFNSNLNVNATIIEQIIIHSISPETKTMSMSFGGLIISENQNFSAYLLIPGNTCQFLGYATPENGGSTWYQLIAKNNEQYTYFPIKPQFDSDLLPNNVFHADYYIVLEGTPYVEYNPYLALHPIFDQSLSRQTIWNASETVALGSKDSIKNYCYSPPYSGENVTVLHHMIAISHPLEYAIKDWLYILSVGIPLLLMGAHYATMREENGLSKQATLFLGIIVVFFTELFGLQQIQASYGAIAEFILIPSMTVYSIMFVLILKRIKKIRIANQNSQNQL